MVLLTKVTTGTDLGTTWTRDALVQTEFDGPSCISMPNLQGKKAIGFSLEDEDASVVDHKDFMRGLIAKFGPRCFF